MFIIIPPTTNVKRWPPVVHTYHSPVTASDQLLAERSLLLLNLRDKNTLFESIPILNLTEAVSTVQKDRLFLDRN